MNQLVSLILLVLVTGSQCASIPAGLLPQSSGRIVGGADAEITDFPYQVSLQCDGRHFCGGSIYSRNVIITAARCVKSADLNTLRVRAGSSNWSSGGVLLHVAKIRIHEKYDPDTLAYDIAVIRLSSTLTLDANIRKIAVALKAAAHGSSAVLSGWGTMEYGSTDLPDNLQYAEVKIIGFEQCKVPWYGFSGYGDAVKKSMICAAAEDRDACQFDSGSPLVVRGELVGIVSWGKGCALDFYPGVYADAGTLRSWIVNNAASI